MSDHAARSALSRMHLRELVLATHYPGFSSDIAALAGANVETAEQLFMARRAELVAAYGFAPSEQRKPFAFSNGIAIIPVHGTLINRFGYSWGYVTGYNFIRQQTAAAGQDPDVLGIVYDHNSYGGEAAGCFECAADIKRLSGGKPTIAMVDSNCYSGSYALACGADKIVVTPSGGVGSVGVVTTHISFEKMLSEAGIKVTFIYEGAHKVDGNPYQDLPDSVKADVQKACKQTMNAFVAHVASGRKMDEKEVRATEARIYRADEAKSLGLIDAVATPPEALSAFLGELSGSTFSTRNKEDAMSTEAKPGADTKATEQELNAAKADAVKAERARVSGIVGCDEAKGRESLAQHLAYQTDTDVDAAKLILAASPKASGTGAAFKEAMDNGAHPNVGAVGGGANGDKPGEQSAAAGILASVRASGQRGYITDQKH